MLNKSQKITPLHCINQYIIYIFVADKRITMNRAYKTLLALTALFLVVNVAVADRGTGKKSKSKVALNIATPSTLKNSIQFNLKSGLTYKGSLLTDQQSLGKAILNSSIITYQKGNTVYIIPYKNKIIMPTTQQGFSGIKLIIQPK